jgi:sulfur-carrier protein
MRVTVKLHATLKKYLPAGVQDEGVSMEVADGTKAGEIIERLGIPPKHAGMLVSGDKYLEVTSVLQEGQEVNVFPPLAGGA